MPDFGNTNTNPVKHQEMVSLQLFDIAIKISIIILFLLTEKETLRESKKIQRNVNLIQSKF